MPLSQLLAEGSRDLYPAGVQGKRASIQSRIGAAVQFDPFNTQGTMWVYVKSGETIYLGSSAQGKSAGSPYMGTINVTAPDGTTFTSGNSATVGLILDRDEELSGPKTSSNPDGYEPYIIPGSSVTAAREGLWKVEFISPSNPAAGSVTAYNVDADGAWEQPVENNRSMIVAFDVSVGSVANSANLIPGRLFTYTFNGNIVQGDPLLGGWYSKFYILTDVGYIFEADMNGQNGAGFNFFSNSKGMKATNGDPSYLSESYHSTSGNNMTTLFGRIHDPRTADNGDDVTHKLFFAKPAADLPETANYYNGTSTVETWLRTTVTALPEIDEITVVGVESGIEGMIGPDGAYIYFESNTAGKYNITLNFGGTFVSRTLTGPSVEGVNEVLWDGRDGNGNMITRGTEFTVKAHLTAAEVHFPLVDVEYNSNGMILKVLAPYDINNYANYDEFDVVYWDDSKLGSIAYHTNPPNPLTNLDGLSSQSNGHKWGKNYGDQAILDTWSYIPSTERQKTLTTIDSDLLDLAVTSIITDKSSVEMGESVIFTIVVENLNSNPTYIDAVGAKFGFTAPEGFIITDYSFTVDAGTASETVVVGTGSNEFSTTLDITKGGKVTYTITGYTLTPGTLTADAFVIRPPDVIDIDATSAVIGPPVDPYIECDEGPSGVGCNNVVKATVNITPNYCVTGCNDNTFLNTGDPNTLEYDNLISVFHSSIVKEVNGVYKIWGQGTMPNGTGDFLEPVIINEENGFDYEGEILKVAAGSRGNAQQFALLTTKGLYVWGGYDSDNENDAFGTLVAQTIKSTKDFGPISVAGKDDGLPTGVAPEDVKMMFGAYRTLAIVTCTGEAWVLSNLNFSDASGSTYGDGSDRTAANNSIWHRVKTSTTTELNNVVAVRGTGSALFALTSNGKLYTWGMNTYINDGNGPSDRSYATEVTPPAGVTPKMIGMTQVGNNGAYYPYAQTYYLLATDGRLFAMGDNTHRQLGNGNDTNSNTWVQPQKMTDQHDQGTGVLDNIAWISPAEHDNFGHAAINVLATHGKQWAWGSNTDNMIGGEIEDNYYDPIYQPGGLLDENDTNKLIAVETGGHTTINIKECTASFGYVGHRIRGSMGDGSADNETEDTYNYTETAKLQVCGAVTAPAVQDTMRICNGYTVNLNDAIIRNVSFPSGVTELDWWTTPGRSGDGGVKITDPVGVGTYYAFYEPAIVTCYSVVIVRNLKYGEPGFEDCPTTILAVDDINQTPQGIAVDGNVLTNDSGDVIKVTEIAYYDSNGNKQTVTFPIGTTSVTVTVYDADKNEAGELTIREDGTYTFEPTAEFTGDVPVDYTIIDKHGKSDDATLTITVIPAYNPGANNPPVAINDNATTKKNVNLSGNILSNDSDPDGDDIKVTEAKQGGTTIVVGTATPVSGKDKDGNTVANAGMLTLNANGTFTFVPATDFVGTVDPVEYTIKDYEPETTNEQGGESTAFLNITVEDKDTTENVTYANDDAYAGPKNQDITADEANGLLANDFDPETNTQTITGVTLLDGTTFTVGDEYTIPTDQVGAGGKITVNANGSFTYTPAEDFIGTVPLVYTVCDDVTPEPACANATLILTTLPKVGIAIVKTGVHQAATTNTSGYTQAGI